MNAELETIARQLAEATKSEDIFGTQPATETDLLSNVRKKYHALARIVHPDRYEAAEEKLLAYVTLGQLIEWFEKTEKEIRFGIYRRESRPANQATVQAGFNENN